MVLQVYYVITDVATMVQEVADHQDMLRSLSESKLFLIFWNYKRKAWNIVSRSHSHNTIHPYIDNNGE